MTLAELRAKINRRTGKYLTDEALNDLINEALTALSLEARWPWLDAVATLTWPDDDSSTTPMPFSWQVIKSVTVGRADEYQPRAQRDLDTFDQGVSDFVRGYAVHGRTIELAPAPAAGATVVIRGTRLDGPLVRDTDEPFLPDAYTEAVIHHAAGTVFDRHHDAARREVHMDAYDGWVRRMKRSVRDQAQGPRLPRVRPGAGF